MNRTTKKLLNLCIGSALLLGFAGIASAGMYKWTDKDGNVHYSQQPPSEGSYESMHVDTQSPNGSETGSGSHTGPTYSSPDTGNSGSSGSSDAIKQTEAKAAEQRQQKCTQAKKALELYTVYRRVRDKSGKVVRLSDTDRASRIKQAKDAIKEFCQ